MKLLAAFLFASLALFAAAPWSGPTTPAEAAEFRRPFQPNPPPRAMQPPGPVQLPNRIVPPRALPGINCRPSCATQCQNVSCSGLSAVQCRRSRQTCRVACTTRC